MTEKRYKQAAKEVHDDFMARLDTALGREDVTGVRKLVMSYHSEYLRYYKPQETPLFALARHNQIDAIETLLRKGADPNHKTSSGRTPIYESLMLQDIETMELLKSFGADINTTAFDGTTLVHTAVSMKKSKALTWLLDNNVRPDTKDVNGDTPLHFCANVGATAQTIQMLIDAGADPNVQDIQGNTPLHIAVEHGLEIMTRVLLQNSALTSLVNSKKRTADTMEPVSSEIHNARVKELVCQARWTRQCMRNDAGYMAV